MLSDFQQDELWRRWIGAEIRSDYFADMGTRYARLQSWLTWLSLFFSAGTVAAMLGTVATEFGWLKIVLGVIVTGISLFSIIMQNPKRYADCSDLHLRWNRLATEYQALWNDVYSDTAESVYTKLLDKEVELSRGSMIIPNRPRIMEKWERHVLDHRMGATASA
jgi:hypothetical protein